MARFVWYVALWTLVGLFEFSDHLPNAERWSVEAGPLCIIALLIAYLWALVTPAVFALTRRFPIERPRALCHAFMHIVFGVAFSIGAIVVTSCAELGLGVGKSMMTMSFMGVFVPTLVYSVHLQVLLYWVVVAVAHADRYHSAFVERDRLAASLEVRASELKTEL